MPKINVDIGTGRIEQMEESDLLKLEGGFEDENEIVKWVQYHLPKDGSMVHRSVHVHLKQVVAHGFLADLG